MEPGVLDLCEAALRTFEDLGCSVEPLLPDHPPERLWQDFVTLRHWQVAANLGAYYRDPAQRALLKPEAVWEVEGGLELTAQDVSAASAGRTAWHHALRKLFERCDVCVLPAAQVFAFRAELHWPADIAGRPMDSYHRWMQAMAPATMGFCPVLAVPAGFYARGLAMGLQLIGPHGSESMLLQLGHAYDRATRWVERRPPPSL
jgi:amidase